MNSKRSIVDCIQVANQPVVGIEIRDLPEMILIIGNSHEEIKRGGETTRCLGLEWNGLG